MTLLAVELYRFDLAMRRPVGTAAVTHRRRPVAFARVVTDEGDGWGECAALAEGTAVDPALDTVWVALRDLGAPRLAAAASARGGRLPPAGVVGALYGTSPVARMVAACLEMAVLDLELHHEAAPLWRRLGVSGTVAAAGVPVGDVVGIPAGHDLDTLLARVAEAVPRSARIRMKVAPGWDLVAVRAVRGAWPDLVLQVDANAAYRLDADQADPDSALRLRELDRFGLVCVEQPLPPADLEAHARLAEMMETPVCLDESLSTLRRVVDALRGRACAVACLKPGRLGGLLVARRAAQLCAEAGVAAFVGGFFETGWARSANAGLAGLPAFSLAGDLSDPAGYLDPNPWPYSEVRGTGVLPYGGVGIGPRPDPTGWRGEVSVAERIEVAHGPPPPGGRPGAVA